MTPLDQLVPLASSPLPTLILLAAVVFGFMFLVQRPMRKQQAAQREMQQSMQPGTRVMLTSGLFGTVSHVGDKQAIVELAPGLEVTVLRQAINKVVGPDDEEFEFSDSASDADNPAGDADNPAVDVAPEVADQVSAAPVESTAVEQAPVAQAPIEPDAGEPSVTGEQTAPMTTAPTTDGDDFLNWKAAPEDDRR